MATAARVSPDARQVVDIGMMVFVDVENYVYSVKRD